MKITMYELLGMVKDGTQPNHIKYRGEEWWWGYDTYTYFACLERTPDVQTNMFTRYVINYCLDDEVEILEEEKKIPEKLEILSASDILDILGIKQTKYQQKAMQNLIIYLQKQSKKINEIIDCLDYLKNKGE